MLNIEDKYKFEVQIEQLNNALNGVTYSYKTTVFYGKATANGSVDKKTGEVKLHEIKTVELKMQQNSYACIMTCNLKYTKNGDDEFLEGSYVSFSERDSTPCGKGTVFLQKVATSDFHKEPFLVKRSIEQQQKEMLALNSPKKTLTPTVKRTSIPVAKPAIKKPGAGNPLVAKKNPVKPKTTKPDSSLSIVKNTPSKPKPPVQKPEVVAKVLRPSDNRSIPDIAKADTAATAGPEIKKTISPIAIPKVLATRENELVKTINLTSREVVINIYDNGTIDHDTVSVYLDKKLVVSKQMLTTNPITVKFTMDDDNAYHEIIMVAENLGDIPPNTSLMVVKSGEQNVEVRITSTEQKNAVVAFRYKKPV